MKLPEPIHQALDETGKPWSLVEMRDGHVKLILDGQMVGKIRATGARQDGDWRFIKNVVAQIRRAARGEAGR
jgi:hypothetical protein